MPHMTYGVHVICYGYVHTYAHNAHNAHTTGKGHYSHAPCMYNATHTAAHTTSHTNTVTQLTHY